MRIVFSGTLSGRGSDRKRSFQNQNLSCRIEVDFAGRMSDASRSVTGKKEDSQFLFQFKKLLVERRLGDKKLFGGVGDIFSSAI